jgi:hypothetical protein
MPLTCRWFEIDKPEYDRFMHSGEVQTANDTSGPKRHGFADLGPAWISSIAAAVAAVVAVASFFAGRATAPTPAGTPAPGPAATASAPATTASRSPGTLLAHYSADVAAGYGIDIAAQPQRPRQGIPGDASLVIPLVDRISSSDGGKLAQLDSATAPTFDDCAANTRFTDTAYVDRGDAFCYTGHGYLAAIKVVNKVIALTGDYDTLDITVWKAPAA